MIDDTITDVVKAAVREALAEHDGVTRLTYTVDQAAAALGCSTSTVRGLINDGVLGTVPNMGRAKFIPRADLEALVSAGASTAGGRTTRVPVVDGPAEPVSPSGATAPLVPLRRHPAGGGPTPDEPLGAA